MKEKKYMPPYTISDKIVNLVSEITEILTKLTINEKMNPNPRLRRDNRVKTIHASLAIENNSLSIEQITKIVNGKRVLGLPKDICEVTNAFEAYEQLLKMNPYSQSDMLKIHKILMDNLTTEAGKFRKGDVGIFANDKLIHMAPFAQRVPQLMEQLITWVENDSAHPLIKSCVFHYEFEFIHPFADGNGRMGRMWQTLLLYQWKSIFGWLPIETLIRNRQEEYYYMLGESDRQADSGIFIEFMLQIIFDSLKELAENEQVNEQVSEQVKKLLDILENEPLSTKEMMNKLGLKHRPTFRNNYLIPAIQLGIVEMTIPDKPNSSQQKYRKKGG